MIKMYRNGVHIQIDANDVKRYLRMGWKLEEDPAAKVEESPEEKAPSKPKTATKKAAVEK